MNPLPLSRRQALQALAATTATTAVGLPPALLAQTASYRRKGRIRHSVVPWCFNPMPVPDLARHAVQLGLQSVELCDPKFWPLLKELGLVCAISSSHGFAKGFAQKDQHAECLAILRARIEQCAAAGVDRVITFSGFRAGLTNEQGIANMVEGLKQIVGFAEEKGVTICLEMLNSRVAVTMKGHPDYFCDDMERSVEICRQVGSPRLKVLFDIYHVQIMHGDVISRIRQHFDFIGHVHTAGVPGRGELDQTQELNYVPLMRALVDLGYGGFVGQEFIPVGEPIGGLSQAIDLCDV